MSILAKSLKKQNKSKHPNSYSQILSVNNFNISIMFVLFVIIIIFGGISYLYIQNKRTSIENEIKLPNLSNLKKSYLEEVKKLSIQKEKTIPEKLNFYLTSNQLDKLYNLAKSSNDEKFLGIYYFLKGDYSLAENYLRRAISNLGIDSSSGSYLAKIYFNKGEYVKSLKVLNSLNNLVGRVAFDKAVVYEKLNDYKNSFDYYQTSLKLIRDPLMKYRIKVKMFVIERNLKKENL
jgi:tetratricopeptide (TPR) repeat protein